MVVAFDAVGPSSSGQSGTSVASISWTHTSAGTSGLAGIVAVAQDATSTTSTYTLTAKWGGVTMTSLGRIASNSNNNYGYIQLFGLLSPPTGAQTISVTCSGTPPRLIGTSISLTGVASFGTAVTAASSANSSPATVTVPGTGTGNMFVAGYCAGKAFNAATSPLTSRSLTTLSSTNGAGNAATGTAPGIASGSQALAYTLSASNVWGAVGVEAKAAAAPVEPTWAPSSTATGGTTTWTADFTQTDAVAAGYQNSNQERQDSSGNYITNASDPVMPWPMKTEPAPWGSPATPRALLCRVPDSTRRNEVVPNVTTWKNGSEYYVGLSVAVDPDMDRFTQNQQNGPYQTIWQLRPSNFTGSPPVSLEIGQGNSHLWGTGGNARPGASPDYQYAWSTDTGMVIEPSTWYPLVIYVGVWSAVNSGRFVVWDARTDTKILDLVPPCGTNWPQGSTGAQDDGSAYPKNGIYHSGILRGATIRTREHRQGTSYLAVKPQLSATEWRAETMMKMF